MPNDHVVAARVRFPGGPSWVLLPEFPSIGYHRRNATTATCFTSDRRTVQVSFVLADPPAVSRWSVHCPARPNTSAEILNAAAGLVLIRIAFLRAGDGQQATDYFVYRAGPGEPSLHLIPGPCPEAASPKRVAVLPGAGEHYSVVFPVPRFEQPDTKHYEIHVFSSESRSWSSRVARISKDRETAADDAVAAHEPSKAIVAAGEMMSSLLAWIDLGRGVLLCNVLDEDPVLRLLQWPVPPPRDGHSPLAARDATFSNGAIRLVESNFDGNGGWTVTVSKRETGSKYWYKCSKADIARILATDSSYSELLRQVWDEDDEATKRGLNKVVSASPTLSLSNEDVVHFTINLKSSPGDSDEPLMLAVNARERRVEAAEQACVKGTCCPCTFFRCIGTDETSDLSDFSAEDSCVAPNRTSVQLGAFSFVVEHDKMMEDESVPPAADVMPSENIFMSGTMHKLELQATKEHIVQMGSMKVGVTI